MLVPSGVTMVQKTGPWTPSKLSPKIWTNETSITTSGSNVTIWGNLGSLGGEFAVPSFYPQINSGALNGLDTLTFGNARLIGSSELLPICNNVNYAWAFCLYNQSSGSSDEVLFHVTENSGTGSRWSYLAGASGSPGRLRSGGRTVDGGNWGSVTDPTNRQGSWVMSLCSMDYANGICTLYINGSQVSQSTNQWGAQQGSTPANNSSAVWIGQYANATSAVEGDIAELTIHSSNDGSSNLSADDVDRVFGYAAHKWGLTASLASNHPYKTIAPYTTVASG